MAIRIVDKENFTQFIDTIERVKTDFLPINGVPLEHLEDKLSFAKWVKETSDGIDWYSQYDAKFVYLLDETEFGKACYVLKVGGPIGGSYGLLFCSPDSWENRFEIMKKSLSSFKEWFLSAPDSQVVTL